MYLVAITPADEALLKEQVESVLEKYKGDVIRIRYDVGFDSDREAEVNFRILVSDKVAKSRTRLIKVSSAVRSQLFDLITSGNSGLLPSFRFRSDSEQQELKDPRWN